MSFLELLFLLPTVVFLVYVLLWILLDCNVSLWYKSHFGLPISSLSGKVVWVTGASSGIGRQLALYLAESGARLVLSARRADLLESVKKNCITISHGRLTDDDIFILPMNMLDISRHEKCFDLALEHFGRLDVLVNNAGRSQRASWEGINVQVDRDLFELNVFSVVNFSRIAVRYFLQYAGGHGHIVVTSSIAGLTAPPYSSTYCAAKHAINSYMKTLRVEHRDLDITVFAPGPVHTDFLQEAFTAESDVKYDVAEAETVRRLTVERCARLYAVAIANKMDLTWCALFPINFFTYALRYSWVEKSVYYFTGIVNRVREGKI